MKKIILIGRSGAGKTTLTQALKGEEIKYHKTQYVNYFECIIDTPGEYAQTHELGYALALYSYEADVVGLLLSATEPYSLYPPNITCMVNREVVGIVTQINERKKSVQTTKTTVETLDKTTKHHMRNVDMCCIWGYNEQEKQSEFYHSEYA